MSTFVLQVRGVDDTIEELGEESDKTFESENLQQKPHKDCPDLIENMEEEKEEEKKEEEEQMVELTKEGNFERGRMRF